MIENFELLAIVFLVAMSYLTFISYKKGEFSKIHLIFWLGIWIIGIIGILFSNSFDEVLVSLKMSRIFDFYTLLAFLFLFFITFHTYKVVKNNERRLARLTRYVALKSLDNGELR